MLQLPETKACVEDVTPNRQHEILAQSYCWPSNLRGEIEKNKSLISQFNVFRAGVAKERRY